MIQTKKILIIDDSIDLADILGKLLEKMGHNTKVVYDGKTALELAPDYKPDFVFIDIIMPTMNGYEVISGLKSQGLSKTKYVALTGMTDEETEERVSSAGFHYLANKPVGLSELQNILQRI